MTIMYLLAGAALCALGMYRYYCATKAIRKLRNLEQEHRELAEAYLNLRFNSSGRLMEKAYIKESSYGMASSFEVVRGDSDYPEIIKSVSFDANDPNEREYALNYAQELADKINEEP